jgi:hypothetical protein
MATLKTALTLLHKPNLGEEAQPVDFEAGAQLEVLKEWREHYLCKDDEGRVFNVPKQALDAG